VPWRALELRANRPLGLLVGAWLLTAGCTCGPQPGPDAGAAVTPDTHAWFPISTGAVHAVTPGGAIQCDSCHPPAATDFTAFDCLSCHGHEQAPTDRLHLSTAGYAYQSQACYQCHTNSAHLPFDHAGITNQCAMCHDVGAPFAVLPMAGFTHPDMAGADCSACHNTQTWKTTGAPPDLKFDPTQDVSVDAQIPTYAGTSIFSLTPQTETVPMAMNHAAPEVDAMTLTNCSGCHALGVSTTLYPGRLHSSLANLMVPEPTSCTSCHGGAAPTGFVGPTATNPGRAPPSPEMKHDAVAWDNNAPTASSVVPKDCGVCHASPSAQANATWATGSSGTHPALFHSALATAGLAQPSSCIDCHANSRPPNASLPVQLDSTSASLPANVTFDHSIPEAMTDCTSCHAKSLAPPFDSWRLGIFHTVDRLNPPSCLPCHAGERPTSTSSWASATYDATPFDYGTNTNGIGHGDGQDCVTCHSPPGAGSETWVGGHFDHAATSVAATTCVACHSAQRPTALITYGTGQTFDHSTNGTGDCFGCHQATVVANRFAAIADWTGGVPYPGGTFISSPTQFVQVAETTLLRSATSPLVTGTSTITATLYNGMLHTSTVLPPMLQAGPTGSPNYTTCWHCHVNNNGTVTSYQNGQYHPSLSSFRATPGGALMPLPQPAGQCADCHKSGIPVGIVESGGSDLQAMDHAAQFTAAVMLGGASVTAVNQADCSACHKSPGNTWSDGAFHPNIGAGTPKDCVGCHYLLMADAAKADLTAGTDAMKHRSAQLPFQTCDTCHAGALANAKTAPLASTLWKPGLMHASLTTQPTACVECHSAAAPPSATQSTVTYALPLGGTASNGAQWMSHASTFVAGKDCAVCHAADAKAAGSAWSKSDQFHPKVASVAACQECHGLTNGNGAVIGTKNNLPVGLTNASMVTTADSTTGVPAGTHDQIAHTDSNVASHDCVLCHRQAGVASGATAGQEWAQASFHASLNAANPLVVNGTTGRCSNCHLNVKPGPAFTLQDHSTFTNAPGTPDCSNCHSFPGTGTVNAPNWLGAMGSPAIISVGGFNISQPPETTLKVEPGIMNLPHPGSTACTTCHASSAGGLNAKGYDHASTGLIALRCAACHEAGSNLVGTAWNGTAAQAAGAGDTRPFTMATLDVSYSTGMVVANANHFYSVDCGECHVTPAGTAATTTGSAYAAAWAFPHNKSTMTNPGTCVMCHTNGVPTVPTGPVSDPNATVSVSAQVPSYSGTSISSLAPLNEALAMSMNHQATELSATLMNTCADCHAGAAAGTFYPGKLHSSLATLTVPQPAQCTSCHAGAAPTGFVGPVATSPGRAPSSPEMKHDAVAWANNAPTTTALVPADCGVCHASASSTVTSWAASRTGAGPAVYHSALAAAALPQPGSCLDCHANTRPPNASAPAVLTSANSTLPAGVTFDHSASAAMTDCAGCHAKSALAPFSSWAQGRFHLAGSSTPTSCVACHSGERPTSTTGWLSTTYASSPFDYGTNSFGIGHGDGQDCVTCHNGPGTGAWGSNQNWATGKFTHGPSTVSGTTCVACHATQRPATGVTYDGGTFNHSTDGTGDCIGCHQATINANRYAALTDWSGGVAYPGSSFVAAPTKFVQVTETALTRSGVNNLVTSTSTSTATLYDGMLHTSSVLPAALNAGPTGSPDPTKCWHCHTNTNGMVTSYLNGVFHASLTGYQATPGGAVTPFPQPTTSCGDCHVSTLPSNIVMKGGSDLQPMDHAAQFTAAVSIGGASVTAVNQADCSACHKSPGNTWTDGTFHPNIGAGNPKDCVGCHYVLMADAAKADLTSGTDAMKHRSAQLTFQSCNTCHTGALANAKTTPLASTLWKTGLMHASLTAQPAACVECHAAAVPATTTQSTVTYPLPLGGTATNGGQWMSHASSFVAGKDCALCHSADAKISGSAWSKSDQFHPKVSPVGACQECHGLTNGNGAVLGTKNNLPLGLTNSTMVTTADSTTGVPAGTHDQITHADSNVSTRDCVLCHRQLGVGSGQEWAQASFHSSLNAANPLVVNGTTGRCSNCHMNVKPGPSFPGQDHSTFTAAPGTTDCSSCHSFPGTGTVSAPNWLGAIGAPTLISVGGFTIAQPPETTAKVEPGIMNLPHPAGTVCTSCHASASGGTNANGYDHASAGLIALSCDACHEAGSNLVGTVWNGATAAASGAGDTRPFTLTSVVATFGPGMTVTYPKHFYPADCGECHVVPAGDGLTTTGNTYAVAWTFPHNEATMTNPGTCVMCHTTGIPGAPTGPVNDPNQSVLVDAGVPRYSGTSMAAITQTIETLAMSMDHASTQISASASSSCANCHVDAASGFLYPGNLHSSLVNIGAAQPAACDSCHGGNAPTGFVGPPATAPARKPASAEMKHDAVAWSAGAPTATALVSKNCGLCHLPPGGGVQNATWATGVNGQSPARFHASLGASQPGSCIDCHANSRPPNGTVSTGVLSSTNAALPANVTFDHTLPAALADCQTCHAKSTQSPWSSWTGGQFHVTGSSNPTTCLPCHSQERPASTTGWMSTTYTTSPFDYVTNANSIGHGDGQDCALCHVGPGTGAWGGTQNWVNGYFTHGAATVSGTTCVACHTTQRPTTVINYGAGMMFNHATNGTGDCIGCHQATVTANRYVALSDWDGGVAYPGSTYVSAPTQFVQIPETTLNRSGTYNLVTSTSSITATLYNGMLHTSVALPAALNAGPTNNPDATKCWHCHTNTAGTVTSYANGQYHSSLTGYQATVGGAVVPFAQPTSHCADCHLAMLPVGVVTNGTDQQPMDHAAQFTAAVTLGGVSVTAVNQADCSVCHKSPGSTWSDGLFHTNIAGATPKDCVGCHYLLMADATKADLSSTTNYAMKHQSLQLTFQSCNTCHASALGNATNATHAPTLWQTGVFHGSLASQPAACIDCHLVSEPPANASTQSSWTYVFSLGGTSTNSGQWENHGAPYVAGKDCVVCHAADAKTSGSAWSKSDQFHTVDAGTAVVGCAVCHGLTNGNGSVAGTKNNLPLGLTSSTTVTSADNTTGVPAGTLDQVIHTDVNVSSHECAFCHTQLGRSSVSGVMGKEWAQAAFHKNFTGTNALLMNGSTGRCSDCHMNVKPTSVFTAQDHSTFTSDAGSQDCSGCHTWPGTGTASTPNWLGAAGMPQYINTGGFNVSVPPAPNTSTLEGPIANLKHPAVATGATCTTCHLTASGGKNAFGYDHALAPSTGCASCHEGGSNLVDAGWVANAPGAIAIPARCGQGLGPVLDRGGDTRAVGLSTLSCSAQARSSTCGSQNCVLNHFYPLDCSECHAKPAAGIVFMGGGTDGGIDAGAPFGDAWQFPHRQNNMQQTTCCICHLPQTLPDGGTRCSG
jgi:hypothetical protein